VERINFRGGIVGNVKKTKTRWWLCMQFGQNGFADDCLPYRELGT
jgi:hypothetical protein